MDRTFSAGGRNLWGSPSAGTGAGGQRLSSDHIEYLDLQKTDIAAERLQGLSELQNMESVEVKELLIRADNAVSGNISYAARSLGGDRGVDAIGTEAVSLIAGAVKAVVLAASLLWLGIVPALLIMAALFFHVFGGGREKRANYEERVKTTPYRNKNQYVTNVMIDFGFAILFFAYAWDSGRTDADGCSLWVSGGTGVSRKFDSGRIYRICGGIEQSFPDIGFHGSVLPEF